MSWSAIGPVFGLAFGMMERCWVGRIKYVDLGRKIIDGLTGDCALMSLISRVGRELSL